MTDYIFIDGSGQLLETGTFEPGDGLQRAQELAQLYTTKVTYGMVVAYNVEPKKCGCGANLSINGTCPDCSEPEAWNDYHWIKENYPVG